MKKEDIKFYIAEQTFNENGVEDTPSYISIEDYEPFIGIHYLKCTGIEDKGKPKNKYTETFADSGELLVCYDKDNDIYLDATDVVFTFIFVGERRQQSYDNFYNYIKKGKFFYYDTVRRKKILITLMDTVKPSADKYVGNNPYIQADFKFKNLWGESKSI